MDVSNESKQSHVDPYEGRVVDSGIKGTSDVVTTCSRLSESADGLEHSAGSPGARAPGRGERLVESIGSATGH